MSKFLQQQLPAMASSSQLCKAPDNPHFFKIVLAHALKEQKLEIPKKFVGEYGLKAFENNPTRLKVADGEEWEVGVTKSDGRVWFDYGWQKFVEFYNVGLEYFLVFKYELRSSCFHVVIFDPTATEIKYPLKKKLKMGTNFDDLHLISHPHPQVGKASFGAMELMNNKRKLRLMTRTSERAGAMAKATTFQSMTPNPSFMCKIYPSHIQSGAYLNVPRRFAERHIEEPTEMTLQDLDGRTWGVTYYSYLTPKMKRRVELRSGWRKFFVDNDLKVADFCVFEMISKNSTTIAFKVDIFRAS
ncbi:B3 domain-containing protein REM8-like isoform X1 [Cucurbita maxima]|uniref:B3 domain-containing protein REM8-like isoform X1 n=1 Tax=Cucurbita maxima TaxID=3661 RepID=A0A6J1I7N8_CUCMA|nr:B3 domain-containing protein REM8-like isoform X1 [Cucurbita maxima]